MLNCKIEIVETDKTDIFYRPIKKDAFLIGNMSERQVILKAKKLAGWTGIKCKKIIDYDDCITLRPVGINQVMFIEPEYLE